MKTLIFAFMVVFLSMPAAMAQSVDGKGVYCPSSTHFLGWWFEAGLVTPYFIHKLELRKSRESGRYYDSGLHELRVPGYSKRLDRRTLVLKNEIDGSADQCVLVHSLEELTQKIENQIDAINH